MTLVNFSNLDFDQIKTSIKNYIKSNSDFTDYDFDGSNLSLLINTLAYNTYITSYNANMVSNEVFIDSATLRENVVSLARNIGYVPRSKTAARANITFLVDTSSLSTNPITLTLQRGIVATSLNNFGNQSFTFAIMDDITVPVVDNVALFENIEIYEGTYLTQNYEVDSNNLNQRYILDNRNIDISTLSIDVRNTKNSTVKRKFVLENSLFDILPKSKVFFIQEIEDQNYEVLFGDDIFGKKLDNLNFLELNYLITNGEDGNGISRFNFNGRIIDNQGRLVTSSISVVSTLSPSRGGQSIESVNSIKKYAPRIYASQNRAVTASDYEAIIPKIYPEAESVSAFGGETLTPPQYGKVFITIKPINGPFLPNSIKDNLKQELRRYSVAGVLPEILDLKYLYIEADINAYYNSNLSSNSNSLKTQISNNIQLYSESSDLNNYGARFKYSKFLKLIDNSSNAITSNITKIKIRRDLKIVKNQYANYEICYGNEFYSNCNSGFNIKSSGFKILGVNEIAYLTDIPIDDESGKIIFFKLENGSYKIVRNNAGKINYRRGEINLFYLNILDTLKTNGSDNIIEISALPKSNDILGIQDLYLQLDTTRVNINMIHDNIDSRNDISGTTYITTSSYYDKDLIRN
jgi:hypothetical protein